MEIKDISLSEITDPLFQPRGPLDLAGIEALASSIREIGLINPIIVQTIPEGYRLIAGTRRFHAFKMLGKDTIPAKVVQEADRESTMIQFCENFHRQDLNPIEQANMLKFLLEEIRLSTVEIAQLCNKSRDWVSHTLSLLEMPDYMQHAVETLQISPSVAQELKRIPDETMKESYFQYALQGGCTEKQARQWTHQAIATIAARDSRAALRESPSTTKEQTPPPTPEHQPCYICGAPETAVLLESIPVCWHCKRKLTPSTPEIP